MNYLFMVIFLAILPSRYISPNSTFYTAIPIKNSIEVPGQDEETINPDSSSPSLIAIHCKSRHGAQAVIKIAKSACKKIKKTDFWITGPIGWFRTYPAVYPICRAGDGFEIAGNPYYLYPLFKPLFAVPELILIILWSMSTASSWVLSCGAK
ncbi:hypothetical protein OnM2_015044 [Erysiphe neolycopersici]|uniref:Uncharacterized protein n=1 Tax=Erysiphe neolycopersici TaxID=212602 RepID=A0A420I5B6_9PEZI|nr:hypothetical protein OnM2_015044 [Erysiphe neolycopersici]